MKRLLWVWTFIAVLGCGDKKETPSKGGAAALSKDSPHRAIYDVAEVVIRNTGMRKNFGLKEVPAEHIFRGDDETLLTRMILPPDGNPIARLNQSDSILFEVGLRRCLKEEDVPHMISQKDKYTDFRWNVALLGFDSTNTMEWYEMTVPVFSKDSSRVVVGVHYHCSYMECSGNTPVILYRKGDGWESEAGPVLLH